MAQGRWRWGKGREERTSERRGNERQNSKGKRKRDVRSDTEKGGGSGEIPEVLLTTFLSFSEIRNEKGKRTAEEQGRKKTKKGM